MVGSFFLELLPFGKFCTANLIYTHSQQLMVGFQLNFMRTFNIKSRCAYWQHVIVGLLFLELWPFDISCFAINPINLVCTYFQKFIKFPLHYWKKYQCTHYKVVAFYKNVSNTLLATNSQVDITKFCIMFPWQSFIPSWIKSSVNSYS